MEIVGGILAMIAAVVLSTSLKIKWDRKWSVGRSSSDQVTIGCIGSFASLVVFFALAILIGTIPQPLRFPVGITGVVPIWACWIFFGNLAIKALFSKLR